jgi:hypothetical protein
LEKSFLHEVNILDKLFGQAQFGISKICDLVLLEELAQQVQQELGQVPELEDSD